MATPRKMTKTNTEMNTETKKYNDNDLIPCRSLTSGELYIVGNRSNFLYSWADYDDVVSVEYRDLIYMIRSNDKNIYEPRIIIEDDEMVDNFPKLGELYDSLYNVNDLRDIINLPQRQMVDVINGLPKGAKESLKSLISTMIDNRTLDSVSKIKVLDDIFGTKMLLTLAEK